LACDEEASSSASAPLLEGLVNNLFIVATHGIDDAQTRVVVQTASVAEGALPGIIRIAVLAACHDLGYTIIEAWMM
jgi:branched-subunit amino acid aminotransferase/4-amino-4-deoxychorismate lyase